MIESLDGFTEIETVLPVPAEVPLWAFRVVAIEAGLKDAIETAIAAMEDPAKTAALELWERGNFVTRDSPTVVALTPLLGLTTEQVDDYFRQAAILKI
ncbi:MAG: hypothetical protein QM680_13635 [Luteolibacter sp.]